MDLFIHIELGLKSMHSSASKPRNNISRYDWELTDQMDGFRNETLHRQEIGIFVHKYKEYKGDSLDNQYVAVRNQILYNPETYHWLPQ